MGIFEFVKIDFDPKNPLAEYLRDLRVDLVYNVNFDQSALNCIFGGVSGIYTSILQKNYNINVWPWNTLYEDNKDQGSWFW